MSPHDTGRHTGHGTGRDTDIDGPDTADLDLPPDLTGAPVDYATDMDGGPLATGLLDNVPAWGPIRTDVGVFQLVPVSLERDLALISTWMNDADVALFWMLSGAPRRTAEHVKRQLDGDGRSVPCLGFLDGLPMSYWELYRADLDPIAFHYPSQLHDTGIHLLIGSAEDRGRGVGAALLRGVTELVLRNRAHCRRLVSEPDVRNAASVAAFEAAGFTNTGEVTLSDKRAAIMIKPR